MLVSNCLTQIVFKPGLQKILGKGMLDRLSRSGYCWFKRKHGMQKCVSASLKNDTQGR